MVCPGEVDGNFNQLLQLSCEDKSDCCSLSLGRFPHEYFIGLYVTDLITLNALVALIKDSYIAPDESELENCRGQCYDGAIYTHCYGLASFPGLALLLGLGTRLVTAMPLILHVRIQYVRMHLIPLLSCLSS